MVVYFAVVDFDSGRGVRGRCGRSWEGLALGI